MHTFLTCTVEEKCMQMHSEELGLPCLDHFDFALSTKDGCWRICSAASLHFSLMDLLWTFRVKNKFYIWQRFLSWFQLNDWHSSRPWINTSWFVCLLFFYACIQCSCSPSFQVQTELCGLNEEPAPWPVPLSWKSSFSESHHWEGKEKKKKK